MRILKILLLLILCFSIFCVSSFAAIDGPYANINITSSTSFDFTAQSGQANVTLDLSDFESGTKFNCSFAAYSSQTFVGGNFSNFVYYVSDLIGCHTDSSFVIPDAPDFSFVFNHPANTSSMYLTFHTTSSTVPFYVSWGYNIPDLIPFTGEGITVPAGYCCVIDRAFNDVVSTETYSPLPYYAHLSFTSYVKSPLFGKWNTNVTYGHSNVIPTAKSISYTSVDWLTDPSREYSGILNNRSIYGMSDLYYDNSDRYFFVFNEPYTNYGTNDELNVSPTITINFTNQDGTPYHGFCGWYKLYKLNSEYGLDITNYRIDTDSDPIPWQGELNEAGDEYIKQGWGDDYNTPSPQLNGNTIYQSTTSESLISSLSQLFNQGQEKVDNLTQQGNGFFSFLSNLFSWMPSELIAIVSSVFIIFLVVACIKLFL